MWMWLKRKALSAIVEERLKQAYKDLMDAEDSHEIAELNTELYGKKVARLESHLAEVRALERRQQELPTLHDVVAFQPTAADLRGRSERG